MNSQKRLCFLHEVKTDSLREFLFPIRQNWPELGVLVILPEADKDKVEVNGGTNNEVMNIEYFKTFVDAVMQDFSVLMSGQNVSKWMASIPFPYTQKDAIDFIKYVRNEDVNKHIHFAIVL